MVDISKVLFMVNKYCMVNARGKVQETIIKDLRWTFHYQEGPFLG